MPWVIDADGLNNLALEIDRLRHAKTAPVLTPHPGEMARLIGKSTAEVNADRVEIARAFRRRSTVAMWFLKGARTVIATAERKGFHQSHRQSRAWRAAAWAMSWREFYRRILGAGSYCRQTR